MRRYHFSIRGSEKQFGLAGDLFAENDDAAVAAIQEMLDALEGYKLDLAIGDAQLEYANLYVNGMGATKRMIEYSVPVCDACHRDETEPHTEWCPVALVQDAADGDEDARRILARAGSPPENRQAP